MIQIPFLTLAKYDGQVVTHQPANRASKGVGANHHWLQPEEVPPWIASAVEPLFRAKGDTLDRILKLDYSDASGLGNEMYLLRGTGNHHFFIKILGNMAGNGRELLVWRTLGYGNDAPDVPQIIGLPIFF